MGLRWMDGATTSCCSAVQCFDGKDGSRLFPSWFAPSHVFGSCGTLSPESSRDSWYTNLRLWLLLLLWFTLLLLSFASFILCFGFLRKTSPLEVCERASHDFDHILKNLLASMIFSSQPSTKAYRRNQLHCLKELHLAKLSRTACCLSAACSQKLFLQTFSTLAGPEWSFLIFGHGLGTSSSVSIWNWIWSFWFANGLLFSPAP